MADWRDVQAQLEKEFACPHARLQTTYSDSSRGVRTYAYQCVRCGRRTQSVPKAQLSSREIAAAIPFDRDLDREWWERRQARQQWLTAQQQREEQRRFWLRYRTYLSTPEWARRRELVLKRAGNRCEGCGVRLATEVHHLTYKRLGREMLFDLVAVCTICHQAIHHDEDP